MVRELMSEYELNWNSYKGLLIPWRILFLSIIVNLSMYIFILGYSIICILSIYSTLYIMEYILF